MEKNKKNTNTSAKKFSNKDLTIWISCFLVGMLGLYIFASAVCYFFCWKADSSLLLGLNEANPLAATEYANPCGPSGARIAQWLIGDAFGVFGLLLPLIMIIASVKVVYKKDAKLFNHTIITLALTLILGSLTLGYLFGEKITIFGSGLGGAFGIDVASLISTSAIGGVGLFILLLVCWVLLGVFVNRNFINTVNRAGEAAYNSGEKIVDIVKKNTVRRDKNEANLEVEKNQNIAVEPINSDDIAPREEETISFEQAEQMAISESEPQSTMQIVDMQPEEVVEVEPIEAIEPAKVVDPVRKADDNPFTAYLNPDLAAPADAMFEQQAKPKSVQQLSDSDSPFTLVMNDETEPKVESEDIPTMDIERPSEEPAVEPNEVAGTPVYVEANVAAEYSEEDIESDLYDPLRDLNNYQTPPISLLENYTSSSEVTNEEVYANKSKIEETLKYFNIPIIDIKATVGPTITLYEIVQAQGVKISKIQGLENDIAQGLKAPGIRIIAPIPGKGTIGIEVPNHNKQIVSMYSSVLSVKFREMKADLPIVIGRTIQNENFVFDLAKMPHLLVAGATGQGKSVGLNAIITSLLYRMHPSQLKFVMIDPKMVELSLYRKLERHFMAKMESEDDVIITDPKKAVYTLNALCEEMEKRLKLLSQASSRNIKEYNAKFVNRRLNPDKGHFYMPYIVVVVDEFADLIMTAREVEFPVMRLAQKARAVGIHLIIATQRPDVKVITGGIKANFPARVAFRVMQMIDSRTIIDQSGANQLIGRGDMLFLKDGELTRIQCALVETDEVERVVDFIGSQQGYSGAYQLPDYTPESTGSDSGMGSESGAAVKYDVLFAEIARAAVSGGSISTSSIQRNYEVGFNRAGRIMTQLERSGIVGRAEGAKPREIYFHDLLSLEAKLQELGVN